MIIITESQKNYLEGNECYFGEDLHKTLGKSKKKTYLATESPKIKNLLQQMELETVKETYVNNKTK